MKKVGEILKEARIKKKLSLEEVEKLTRIRVKYLQAIEENNFKELPQGTTVKGFIKNYSQVVGLDPQSVLAVFRRDFMEDHKGLIIPRGITDPMEKSKVYWTPKMTTYLFGVFFFVLFLSLMTKLFWIFFSPPKITIIFPPEGEIFSKNEVEVVGRVSKDASLYVNGEIVDVSEKGEFRKKIFLSEGENEIIFEAFNRRKQNSKIIRKVKFIR